MMAVRVARATTTRDGLLCFAGCYHGSWDAVVQQAAPGVPAAAQQDVLRLPFGDEGAFLAALERHGERLACVLLDLMPHRVGLHPAEPAFATLVREETARRGIALILDEVITVRAAVGGMQQTYGIEGDLVVLGKLIGGGLPIGALGGRAELIDVFDPAQARRRGAERHVHRQPRLDARRGGSAGCPRRRGDRPDRRARGAAADGADRAWIHRDRTGLAAQGPRPRSGGSVVAAVPRGRFDRRERTGVRLHADG